MPLTVLHTSDWHLGASLETASRDEEQRRFLDWLLGVLRERRVDLLLVAGDVFHHAQPSAEALSLYYRFLARLGETGVSRAVVVGGNHDSPSRLDAPRDLLGALSVDVVGGLSSASEARRCLVPIEIDGTLRAVVAAVPFVHEFRLGVRTTGATPGEIAERVGEVFGDLYGRLAAGARELSPDVPLLATGHMTVGAAADGLEAGGADFETPIHQVGGVTSLPTDLFGDGFAYVALGHIHRAYPLEGSGRRIWYSGSPVPLSVPESRHPRKVLLVEVGDERADDGLPRVVVEQVPVPLERRIVPVQGRLDEVIARLGEIEPIPRAEGDLQPYAVVDLEVTLYRPGATEEIHRAVAELPPERRPRVVRVVQRRRGGDGAGLAREERLLPGRLAELDPETVFVRLAEVDSGGAPPSEELLAAFRAVASLRDDDQDAHGGPAP
jgi:exonuclease SbcD